MTSNLKTKLLLGAAGVALAIGASPAFAADGATPATTSTISTATTGDAGSAGADDGAGGAGDDGVQFGAANITVTTTNTVTGGAGGAAAADANSNGGNVGGAGGAGVNFPSAQDGSSTSSKPALAASGAITGGAGTAGGAAGAGSGAQAGGAGGAGGDGILLDSNYGTVTTTTGGTITGGAGAAGGSANGAAVSGAGGAGGAGIDLDSDNNTVTLGANVTGGAGGAGAQATGAGGTGGAGGAGGSGIETAGASASITVGSGVTVSGGAGGAAGAANGGNAGAAGADGAGIVLAGTAGTLVNSGTIAGGNSGAGIALDINAATTSVTNNSGGTIGGSAHAGNAVDIAGGVLTTLTNNGTIQTTAGDAITNATAITTFTNTGTVTASTGVAMDVNAAITTFTNSGTISTSAGTGNTVELGGAVTTFSNSGTISSTGGSGLLISTAIVNTASVDLNNASGTITTAATGAGNAALEIAADQTSGGEDFVISGGTISNTNTAGNAGIAIEITADQTDANVISLASGTTVVSNGSGGSGSGVAIAVNTGGADTLSISNAGTVTGQITKDNAQVLTVTNTGTITGAVNLAGTGGANTITNTGGTITGAVTGSSAVDTLNVNGGSIVGATDLAAGENVLNVDGDFTTGGTFTATGGDIDIAIDAGKTLTLNHAFGRADAITLAAGSGLVVNETSTAGQGALTNTGGTVTIAAGKILDVADHTAAASGVYVFKVASASSVGSMNISAGDFDLTGSTMQASVVGSNFIASGTELKVAEGTAAATGVTDGTVVTDNSFIYTFTAYRGDNVAITTAGSDNTNVWYEVTRASLTGFANQSNSGVAALFDDLGTGGDATLDAIQGNIGNASTQEELNNVLESTTSTVDGGNVIGGLTVANSTANVTSARLASLRDGTAGQTGMAAGNVSQGLRAWGQVFGTTGEQDLRDGVDGFDVDSVGFAAGIDTENLAEDWVWGLAFSYADTDVDSKNSNTTKTEIDSYQISLYGDYDLDDRTYVAGQVGYIWSNNDTTRHNVGGTSGLTAKGDFDSDQIIARVEVGRDYMVGTETTLTPNMMVNYNHYDADNYVETGASGANLTVDSEALDVLEIGVGVDASWTYQQANGGYFKPSLSAGVRYDVIGDEVEATNTFAGGGSAFKTEGFDPAQTTMDLGAGVTYFTTDNWELSADYNYEFKSDYDAHSGVLKAAYKF